MKLRASFFTGDLLDFLTFIVQKCVKRSLWGFLLLTISAQAANNWYVRPGGTGSKTGTDWNNAWDTGGIGWSSVNAGDTIWLAGGTYGNSITVGKSGTAGNLIYVKRVLSTDPTPTSAAGWNSAFDSQVIIAPAANSIPLLINQTGVGSYTYFDGRVDSGISLQLNPNCNSVIGAVSIGANSGGSVSYIVFTNLDMLATARGSTIPLHVNLDCPFMVYILNPINNIVISHCRLHGGVDALNLYRNVSYITIEYSKLYDNGSSGGPHANLLQITTCGPMTFRYNDCWNWNAEGFFWFGSNPFPYYIYGNFFHDTSGTGRVMEPEASGVNIGPIYFFNNTLYNIPGSTINISLTQFTHNGMFENNLYINCANEYSDGDSPSAPPGLWDYNYANNNILVPDVHKMNNTGINPLLSPGVNGDFHIKSNISSVYPRDKGTSIAPINGVDFSKDADGNTRGADGAWDIGAYEYVTQNIQEPVISNILSVPGTNTTATITWTTDQNANSIVDYGITTAYGSSVTNSTSTTSHSITLLNLIPAYSYNYQARSINSTNGVNSSGNKTFMTTIQGLHIE